MAAVDDAKANRDERDFVAPSPVLHRLAAACLIGAGTVVLLARERSPLVETVAALVIQAVVCLIAARLDRRSKVRAAALLVIAGLIAQSSYFFGTASAFSAVIAVVLAVVGMLSIQDTSSKIGWAVLGVMCGGQLAVVLLVVSGTIEDRSLSRTLTGFNTNAQVIAAHVVLQSVFVVAYVGGRAAQNRYRRIVNDTVMASRRAVTREMLLEEAQADYARAVALRKAAEPSLDALIDDASTLEKQSLDPQLPSSRPRLAPASAVRDAIESVSMSGREPPPPRESRAVLDDGSVDNWMAAYRSKLIGQDAIALGLCLAGVVFVALSVPEQLPRNFGLVGITGIAACIAARAWLIHDRPHRVVAWPWDVIGLLSVGPAYAIGVHSGFATIVATGMFMSGLFETGQRNRWYVPLVMVCGGHATLFLLIANGVLPDTSNIRLWTPDTPKYDPYFQHALVQAIYVASHLAGRLLDRRFVDVYERARVAFRSVARADARLRVARAELDAAQGFGEGLFTGTEVGPYRVGQLLGRGGMGEVYAATRGEAKVALKLMRADRLGDPAAQDRFEREAKLLLQIAGPHTARVLDVGRDAELPYLAMEHVEGPPLSRILRERELSSTEIVALVSDVTRGLADIHAAGVVHRDIKPSNLLHGAIPQGRRWQIVDFGVSVLAGSEDRSPAGTPQYMAPEQALGEPTDPRADLYSFGLVLYRAITGRPAFVGTDRRAIALAARDRGPPDPREATTLDDDLALVLRIALAADPADRFETADELREAFVGALTGRLDERTRARGGELIGRRPWARGLIRSRET